MIPLDIPWLRLQPDGYNCHCSSGRWLSSLLDNSPRFDATSCYVYKTFVSQDRYQCSHFESTLVPSAQINKEQIAEMAILTFSTTLYILLSTWFIWYVSTAIIAYRRLRHIPGPPLAAVTSLWWLRVATSERTHIQLYDLCARYGAEPLESPRTHCLMV